MWATPSPNPYLSGEHETCEQNNISDVHGLITVEVQKDLKVWHGLGGHLAEAKESDEEEGKELGHGDRRWQRTSGVGTNRSSICPNSNKKQIVIFGLAFPKTDQTDSKFCSPRLPCTPSHRSRLFPASRDCTLSFAIAPQRHTLAPTVAPISFSIFTPKMIIAMPLPMASACQYNYRLLSLRVILCTQV